MGKKRKTVQRETDEEIGRKIILPVKEEKLGIITEFLGAGHLKVFCSDGVTRFCRIPGRIRKRVWMKEGDIVLVALWPFQPKKGDIVHRYTSSQAGWLKRKGYLDFIKEVTEEL